MICLDRNRVGERSWFKSWVQDEAEIIAVQLLITILSQREIIWDNLSDLNQAYNIGENVCLEYNIWGGRYDCFWQMQHWNAFFFNLEYIIRGDIQSVVMVKNKSNTLYTLYSSSVHWSLLDDLERGGRQPTCTMKSYWQYGRPCSCPLNSL